MVFQFRQATQNDLASIWEIIQQAIARRKSEGSKQWQDGYPNPNSLEIDIQNQVGFVLTLSETIVGYSAVLINDEPAYAAIEGHWLTNGDFIVVHRVAIHDDFLGQGLAIKIFEMIADDAKTKNIKSIKVDTNFDNLPMLHIFKKLGYQYCGQVYFRGNARQAFEKVLI
jgi:N-acetylglutamate synthase-like GNAT family acetyltransferase